MLLRPANIADCADLAILDDMAGHGLPCLLWRGSLDEDSPGSAFEAGREQYRDTGQPCNWTNAVIAEADGETAGMAVGYAIPADTVFPSSGSSILMPIFGLFAKAAGTWLVDALAVYGRYRRRGIARALLRDQIGRAQGGALHIVAADDNESAMALYRGEGFAVTAQEPFVPFKNNQTTRAWLLMQRPAQSQGM